MKNMIDWNEVVRLSVSDRKSPVEKCLKGTEEMGELAEAVLSSSGAHACAYKGSTRDDVVKEAADVIQCAISVVAKLYENEGSPEDKFREIFADKLAKWEKKQQNEAIS